MSHFIIKLPHFVTKKQTNFEIKYLSHFVIKCHNELIMKPQALLTPKNRVTFL